MILYASCVFLIIACSTNDASSLPISLGLHDSSSSKSILSGFIDTQREKRSLLGNAIARGLKAVEKLLKDSKPVSPKKNFYKFAKYGEEYEKPGGYKSAIIDFHDVNPVNIRHYKLPGENILTVGTVGDRTLYLKKVGAFGRPTLEILQNVGRPHEMKSDLIIYAGSKPVPGLEPMH